MPRGTQAATLARTRAEAALAERAGDAEVERLAEGLGLDETNGNGEHFSLVPHLPPTALTGTVPTALIDAPPGTPPPGDDLIANIRAFGIMTPLAVRADGGRYTVIAGARRLLAARQLGLLVVPVAAYSSGETPAHTASAMTLSENMIRRANPLREMLSIQTMLAAGATEATIAEDLHIDRPTIQSRLRLARLTQELRDALTDGRLPPATADLASRLDALGQQTLVTRLHERAHLQPEHRRRIRAAEVRALLRGEVESDGETILLEPPHVTRTFTGPEDQVRIIRQENGLPLRIGWRGEVFLHPEEARLQCHLRDIEPGIVETPDGERFYTRSHVERAIMEERNATSARPPQPPLAEAGLRRVNAHTVRVGSVRYVTEEHHTSRLADARAEARREALAEAQAHPVIAVASPDEAIILMPPVPIADVRPEDGWAGVSRLLSAAMGVMPVEATPEHDSLFLQMEALTASAARLASGEPLPSTAPPEPVPAAPRRPRSRRAPAPAAPAPPPAVNLPMGSGALVRGLPVFAYVDAEGSRRYFMRFLDGSGQPRRRYMREEAWNQERLLADERTARTADVTVTRTP